MAEAIRPAMPMPAEPAPRKRTRWSRSLPPVALTRGDQSGQHHAGRALDIIVVAAHLVAIAGQQVDRVAARPVLEVDAAEREHLLHRLDELVHERVELLGRRARPPQAQGRADRGGRPRYWCRRRGTSATVPAAGRRPPPCRVAACRWECPCRWRRDHPGRGCGRRRSRKSRARP